MSLKECLELTENNIKSFHGAANGRIKIFATIEGVGTCSDDLMLGAKEIADRYGTLDPDAQGQLARGGGELNCASPATGRSSTCTGSGRSVRTSISIT